MKIAQYHGANGKADHVRFIKGPDKSARDTPWDRAYITTLFSFEFRTIRRAAAALTRVLFSTLAPGGRLIVTNFMPSVWEAPYLDAFMDWQLICDSTGSSREKRL